MREKIRIEDVKEFKIEKKVFDERTLLAIYKLLIRGTIKSVESVVREGKESLVLSAKDKQGNWLALKVYRVMHVDFKSMWKYLAGDPRFSGIKKNRRFIVYNWCKREFRNLKIAYEEKVSCPRPIDFWENILVTELIGEGRDLAPRLIDIRLEYEDAKKIYSSILKDVEKLFHAGLVHSDLSAYNILLFDKPYIIDFSQAVPLRHQMAAEFLRRDIKNINSYFKKCGIEIESEEELFKKITKGKNL